RSKEFFQTNVGRNGLKLFNPNSWVIEPLAYQSPALSNPLRPLEKIFLFGQNLIQSQEFFFFLEKIFLLKKNLIQSKEFFFFRRPLSKKKRYFNKFFFFCDSVARIILHFVPNIKNCLISNNKQKRCCLVSKIKTGKLAN